MMTAGHIRQLYDRYTAEADVAITEGVMGLFDGAQKREGSSADLAALLHLPVILVLNAKAMAYSAAALLFGLKNFDPSLKVAGVLFNFVDSPTHYRLLEEACADVGVAALGHLPTNKNLHIPSRHLGLDTAEAGAAIEAAAHHITSHLDLDAILDATRAERPGLPDTGPKADPGPKVRNPATASKTILVARDAAFLFLYPENLRRLEALGDVQFFSPLNDTRLRDADLLYLPGGYPECYLEQLAGNRSLLNDIHHFAQRGRRILAECGGMMLLGQAIIDETGRSWPMAGVLEITTSMQAKKLSLGYRTLTIDDKALKGHEFHYSQFTGSPGTGSANLLSPAAQITVRNARGQEVPAPVFHLQTIFASYMHFYWGETTGPLGDWLGR
jgi:cobyrinic acid a,c-diamide synthase